MHCQLSYTYNESLNGYSNNLFNYQHNTLSKGMTLKDHLLEAKEMFGPLLAVISQSHRAEELYALCVL